MNDKDINNEKQNKTAEDSNHIYHNIYCPKCHELIMIVDVVKAIQEPWYMEQEYHKLIEEHCKTCLCL